MLMNSLFPFREQIEDGPENCGEFIAAGPEAGYTVGLLFHPDLWSP